MVDEYIKQALEYNYILSIPIEEFKIEDLENLLKKAKENNILVTLKVEYSNAHQGVLVNLVKKDILNKEFIIWI